MSRTFVITGGAKGIGRCMVEYFASKGDKVYFIDNDAKTTIVVSNQLRGKGWDVHDFVGDIADNTGSINDSLDITEEDLKYLRDIAEQEAINRFTTAEITNEQTNNNNVSGSMDLDGVVSGLTDAVNEAVDIITEGVHE